MTDTLWMLKHLVHSLIKIYSDLFDFSDLDKTDNMDDYVKSQEFDLEFLNVTSKDTYYPCCKEPYPSVTYYYRLTRKPSLYHYMISVPALVAIISSLATFWFPIRSKIRFVMNGISLLTLTLLLLHLSKELGFSSVSVPIAGQNKLTFNLIHLFQPYLLLFQKNSAFP